jgi:putative phosphoesterase
VRVALVSDTHGHSDPLLPGLFQGCAAVFHAGDIVSGSVLELLAAVAPVTAVRGNNDLDPRFHGLPETVLVPLGPLRALLVHDLGAREAPHPRLRAALSRERPDLVIHGHSHRPGAALVAGRLYVNPGSAGPRRFSQPRTAAILSILGRRARVELFELSGSRAVPHGEPLEVEL